jgi:hypothetical protein
LWIVWLFEGVWGRQALQIAFKACNCDGLLANCINGSASRNESALMIQNLPGVSGAAPNRRPTRDPFTLNQGVSHEIIVGGNFLAVEVSHFPNVFGGILVFPFKSIQNEFPALPPTRSADLPKRGVGHLLKIFAGGSEFPSVK